MTFTLSGEKRQGNADAIRAEGLLPAVVYGPHIESFSISVPAVAFEKLYNEAGESTLIELSVEGQTYPVLIQDLQVDPVKRLISHVDFRHVTMGEEMDVSIELTFVGQAPAEKELGGVLVKTKEYLEVRCKPNELKDQVEVDLSTLKTFEDAIKVADLNVPSTWKLLDDPQTIVAKVSPSLTEEEIKAMEEAGQKSIEDIEVEAKGKKEEEATEE